MPHNFSYVIINKNIICKVGDNMNFIKLRKTKFRSYFTVLMCVLTAITGFCGCSFAYTPDDGTADKLTSGVYSAESAAEEIAASSEDVITEEITADESTFPENEEDGNTAVTYTFRNDKLLNDHFEKHNEDFGYATVEEYVEGANRVINDENSLHKLEAEDGDDVYYLEETNEFVIVSTDGYIRTYFKPSKGIDYYNRQ